MGIKYELAPDIQERVNDIAKSLYPHVKLDSVVCLRSHGSSSRGTIARCHALGKAMQIALGRKGFYLIEVISKRFDKMNETEQTKTLIHELMHIPKSFGGGFIHHNVVNNRNVEKEYRRYMQIKNGTNENGFGVDAPTDITIIRDEPEIIIEEDPYQKELPKYFVVKRIKKRKGFFFG